MFTRFDLAVDLTRDVVKSIDPAIMTGAEAKALLMQFAEMERLCAAGRLVLAKRVDETGAWVGGGHRNAAEWMAHETGGSVRNAIDDLDTSWNLGGQPSLDDAVRSGDLSTEKANAVSAAAKKNPDAEGDLVSQAKRAPLSSVREKCNKVKARAEDPAKRATRCHKNRRTYFTDEIDGMVSLITSGSVARMAQVKAALEKRTDQLFRQRNREGAEQEPRDRYMFDALVEMILAGEIDTVAGARSKPARRATRTNVQVRVDLAALRRGQAEDGEICDAPGTGELTVGEVQWLLAQNDTIIDALLTRGEDILKIVRMDRYVPVALQRALELRDPTCVVDGCNRTQRLERDHTQLFSEDGPTSLSNLARLCPLHHRLKTLGGWVLTKREGEGWDFNPPEPRARTG